MIVETLSEVDKIFRIWNRQADFYLLNHLLILANNIPVFTSVEIKDYLAKVETMISQSNGKQAFQDIKWNKFTSSNYS